MTSLTPPARDLTPAQHEAVYTEHRPLCVIAGAGSGKTRVLTRRIARRALDGSAPAAATTVVTFTRKAAGELRHRLSDLGVAESIRCGTFHAIAFGMLRDLWRMRGRTPRAVLPDKARIVRHIMDKGGVPPRTIRLVAAEIEWAKARALRPEDYRAAADAAGREAPVSPTAFLDVFVTYEREKRRRGLVDFEDLIGEATRALVDDAAFTHVAAAVTQHVYVDEFQDVNPAQHAFLEAMLAPHATRGPADLCVVGDDDQTIFGFTGAGQEWLQGFARHWPGAHVISLEENFRCPPRILDAARALLVDSPHRHATKMQRAVSTTPGHVSLVSHATDSDELDWITATLVSHQGPRTPWDACAVLVRTNAEAARVAVALGAAGIPHTVGAGAGPLASTTARALLARLHREDHPPGEPFPAFVAEVVSEPIGAADTDVAQASAATTLVDLARDYAEAVTRPDVAGFTDFLRSTSGYDTPGPAVHPAEVAVLTMHRAKGLEFDVVVVPGLEEGNVPTVHARTPAALEEERRLLYVAMTRARRFLYLSWAALHQRGGRIRPRRPSRYLRPIEEVTCHHAAADAPSPNWESWLRRAREELRSANLE
ncbi:MAG: ATP-dependent helicase [Acidimicrobiia bacterium]|nr:ATP-dependent helicase [Acidimicrobiia bacterium]